MEKVQVQIDIMKKMEYKIELYYPLQSKNIFLKI